MLCGRLQVWQLRGRYPNRGYPKIFNDPTVGSEAKKLFEEAQEMLQDFVKNKKVRLNGIAGFYPANSVGDDIEVYSDEARSEVGIKALAMSITDQLISVPASRVVSYHGNRPLGAVQG